MGIRKLTSFIREHFTGWKEKELNGYLVIDGDALCFQLYYDETLDWRTGGEYLEQRDHAIEYFRALKSSKIYPIVVFDGIDYTRKKQDTISNRHKLSVEDSRMKELMVPEHRLGGESASENTTGGSSPSRIKNVSLPRFTKKVLAMILSELNIKYIVVDGEADDDMVRIANYYSCPVLSNDSDFYIYSLKYGFVHMDNFDWRAKPITANVYYLKDMLEQFKLSDGSLRFIIPAIFGNDFISAIEPAAPRNCEFLRHIKVVTFPRFRSRATHPTLSVVAYASHYDNLQDFVNRIVSIADEYLDESKKKMLRENCLKAKKMYDIQEENSLKDLHDKTELRILGEREIPKWLLDQYRCLDISIKLISRIVLGGPKLSTVVKDPKIPHFVSQSLRHVVYRIIGVTESIHTLDLMPALPDSCDEPILNLDTVPTLETQRRKKVIYSHLHSRLDLIESLEEKWRLVTASVIFWNEMAKIPLPTLKALLLTFVTCSRASSMIVQLSEDIKMSPDFKHGPQWLEGLHSFAQWQCCYHDASSLNSVLQMPLEIYSPAFLYSGEFALKLYFLSLSADCGISPVLSKLPEESKALYHQLLSTVLSHKSVCRSVEQVSDTIPTISYLLGLVDTDCESD